MSAVTDQELWDTYWAEGAVLRVNPFTLSNRAVLRRLGPALRRASSVVEVGCAPGAWLKLLAIEYGLAVSGIDYSDVGLEITRKNLGAAEIDVDLHRLDFAEDDLPTEKWDLAFSLGFIEHFTDLPEIIRRHAQLVKPGGTVAVFAPNLSSAVGHLKAVIDAENMAKHVLVDKAGLTTAARASGLEVQWCDYFGPLNLFFVHWRARVLSSPVRYALWGANQVLGLTTCLGSHPITSSMIGLIASKPFSTRQNGPTSARQNEPSRKSARLMQSARENGPVDRASAISAMRVAAINDAQRHTSDRCPGPTPKAA